MLLYESQYGSKLQAWVFGPRPKLAPFLPGTWPLLKIASQTNLNFELEPFFRAIFGSDEKLEGFFCSCSKSSALISSKIENIDFH